MTQDHGNKNTREWMTQADQVMAATYKRTPVVFAKGEGCTLWDTDGNAYLDFVAGIAVCNLGHAHPGVAAAVYEQAKTLVHVSNLYYTMPQTELAAWLVNHSFADRVFFCNSGAEANEAAIKLARKYFKEQLLALKSRHDCVVDVRGVGLLLGMELDRDGLPLVEACLEKGFVINCVQGSTLRFVPPLIVQQAEIDRLIQCLDAIL